MPDPYSVDSRHPLADSPMSRFTFIHEEGETKISYSFHNIYMPEVVEHFKQFILACGFSENCAMTSMASMVEEYEMMHVKFREKSSLSD
jgi:hypothetical protein